MRVANSFVEALESANAENLCITRICTTCGCGEFRRRLEGLADLKEALCRLSPDEVALIPRWGEALMWAFMGLPSPRDREEVLRAWLPHFDNDLRFVDHVIFYVVGRARSSGEVDRLCLRRAIVLAERTRNRSLVETLVARLGERLRLHPGLLDVAMAEASSSDAVYKALVRSGFLESKMTVESRARKSRNATKKLFGAIRRGDTKAITALLAKGPDLGATNEAGHTPCQYAMSLGRQEIASEIKRAADR